MSTARSVLAVVGLVASVAGAAVGRAQLDDLTLEESRYVGASTTLSGIMGRSLGAFADLTSAPRVQDLDWQNDYLGELAVWKAVYAQAQETEAPERFEEVHEAILEGYALYDQAADEARAALETLDPIRLQDATVLVEQAGEEVGEATDLLEELNEG